MLLKEYYSTGEAARLLGISRSTISRKFDLGVFTGKKNVITGDRFISRESLEALMKLYNIPREPLGSEKKRICVSTPDEDLFSLLSRTFEQDPSLHIARLSPEAGVLNECIEKRPDLLIIDGSLAADPWPEIIHSLHEVEELKHLKILFLAEPHKVHHAMTWGVDEVWPKGLMDERGLKGRFYSFLNFGRGISGADTAFGHCRRWTRKAVQLPGDIWIYPVRAPSLRDPGQATVKNISGGGAFLSEVQVRSGVIPCEPFRIYLKIDQPPIKNWRAHCKVIRLLSNENALAAGVQFIRLSKSSLRMIETPSWPPARLGG